jgi:tetratricopeptide (TPR) repeat protein
LQWGDIDSAALLGELLRPPDAPALLLIASYRTEETETSPLLKTLLASLRRFGGTAVRELVVGELSADESLSLAHALVEDESGSPARHAATIARESGGSPLFIGELARHAEDAKIPEAVPAEVSDELTLDSMIQGRVLRLPEPARRLLEIAAVAGQPLSLPVAMRAADLSLEQHQVLGLLRSAHLIRTRETGEHDEIEAYHDRIRETVYAHLEAERLKGHHHRLASVLEAAGTADPETLAVHWSAAGDRSSAARYASLAAVQASEAFAFDRAARLYQLALMLEPSTGETQQLRIGLADALANAGRGAEAARAYEDAGRYSAATEALQLKRQAAEQLLRSGHIDEGLSALRTVLDSMGMKLADTPARALASLLLRRAYASLRGRSFRLRRASETSAEELARVDTCWSVAVGLSMVDVIRGADFQVRHLLLALKAGEPSRIARALATEAPYIATVGVRARRRAEKVLREAQALAHRIDEPAAIGRSELAAGITAYLTGRWTQAVEHTFRAEEILRDQCTGVAWERNTAHHFSLMSYMNLGEWREIGRRLPTLLAEAADRGDRLAEANLGTRLSYVLLLAGDDAGSAREHCREGLVRWSQQGFHTQHYYDLVRQGEIALYAQTPQAAWEIVAGRWGALSRSLILRIQTFRIEVLHLRARIALAAATAADPPPAADAARLLRAARRGVGRLARERTPWARAFSQLIHAGLCARDRRPEDAARLLVAAESEFASSDMRLYTAVTRRCRGQLLGGDEGRMMVEAADAWIKQQHIVNPERITMMLAPGPWRQS